MYQRILMLVYKEILAVWRDKKSRVVLVIPPLVQLLIFAFAATLDVQNVTVGILNLDNGKQGFELVQRFAGAPTIKKVVFLKSNNEIRPFLDNQQGVMVLSIDEQFSRNLEAGKTANLLVALDGRKSNTAQIVAGYASAIIQQFNHDFAAKAALPLQNTVLVGRNWFNPNLIYYWFNVPSLSGILTMMIGLIVTALSVAREREMGTFDQLLVSPLLPVEVMIGKIVPAIILGMAEGTIIIMAGIFLFKIPFVGSLPLLYLGMFVFICSIVGIGLFISSLCNTQQQAILGTYIFMSPAVLLSGFATPIESMPDWLQILTYANPLRYYLVIAKGVFLKAMPLSMVLMNIWPMILMAIINLTAATWLFRKRL